MSGTNSYLVKKFLKAGCKITHGNIKPIKRGYHVPIAEFLTKLSSHIITCDVLVTGGSMIDIVDPTYCQATDVDMYFNSRAQFDNFIELTKPKCVSKFNPDTDYYDYDFENDCDMNGENFKIETIYNCVYDGFFLPVQFRHLLQSCSHALIYYR